MSKIYDELNSAFSAYHGNKWQSLSDQKRKEILSGLENILSNEEESLKIKYLDESIENYKSKIWDLSLLLLGILLGISGNLIANLVDRYFVQYGFVYDLIIIIFFGIIFWYIKQMFIDEAYRMGHEMKKNKVADDLRQLTKDINSK